MKDVRYSIIIPTYNRSKKLIQTLNSLINQNIKSDEYEILIIGEESDKNTEGAMNRFIEIHPNFQVHYYKCLRRSGPAAARNVAIKKSKGNLIFFTSDDCIIPSNWIEEIVAYYRKYSFVAGVGGWYAPPDHVLKNNIFEYYLHISVRWAFGFQMDNQEILSNDFFKTPAGNGSNIAYKKHVLEEVGGFDEQMDYVGWTDWELKKRIMNKGYSLLYIPTEVIHLSDVSLWEFIKMSFNRGRGRYHIIQKYPETSKNLDRTFNLNMIKKAKKFSKIDPRLIMLHYLEGICIFAAKNFTKIKNNVKK